jgi:low temperature requirement protein LtrA
MIAIVGMGIWMHPAYSESYSVGFAASFLATRGLNWIMYLLAHLYDSKSGALHNLFSIPIFAVPMIVSCFVPNLSYILWPITAYGEEIFNWLRTFVATKIPMSASVRVPISIEHLTERNGLFVMIVLGECVAGSMFRKSSVGEVIGIKFFVASALGLLIAFSLQWIYFDTEVLFPESNCSRTYRF